jgi:hypothetical protein
MTVWPAGTTNFWTGSTPAMGMAEALLVCHNWTPNRPAQGSLELLRSRTSRRTTSPAIATMAGPSGTISGNESAQR